MMAPASKSVKSSNEHETISPSFLAATVSKGDIVSPLQWFVVVKRFHYHSVVVEVGETVSPTIL